MGIEYISEKWEELVSSLDFTTKETSDAVLAVIKYLETTLEEHNSSGSLFREIYKSFLEYVFEKNETGEVLEKGMLGALVISSLEINEDLENIEKYSLLNKMKKHRERNGSNDFVSSLEYIVATLDDFSRWYERKKNNCFFDSYALKKIINISIYRGAWYEPSRGLWHRDKKVF